MRLSNPTFFPLKIDFKAPDRASSVLDLKVYDHNLDAHHSLCIANGTVYSLELDVALPQKLIIKLSIADDLDPIELTNFNLAGIKVAKDKLLTCLEYRSNPLDLAMTEAHAIFDLPINRTLSWSQSGYIIINLFHPNPFAWHLYIGNTIQF